MINLEINMQMIKRIAIKMKKHNKMKHKIQDKSNKNPKKI